MKLPKHNQSGITHILAPLLFIAVFAIVGSYVLLKSRAQTPTANASIGTAVSFTAAPDQLQTSGASNDSALVSGEAASTANSTSASNETQLRTLNQQIRSAINNFRTSKGRTILNNSPTLNASARQHSLEMGAKGYYRHPSFDGTVFWKRVQQHYSSDGYSYWTVGENLLWIPGDISADDALNVWRKSPEHLQNLKDPRWRDLGVSAVKVTNAPGIYKPYDVTIITTDFGARH